MKVKPAQKDAYALDNQNNEKQNMAGNYLPSSISQRVFKKPIGGFFHPWVCPSVGPLVRHTRIENGKDAHLRCCRMCRRVIWIRLELHAPAHPSTTILWPRVTCSTPSSLYRSIQVWAMGSYGHVTPLEAELAQLQKSRTRLSQLVCILATALILSSFISAVFLILFMMGVATTSSTGTKDGITTSYILPPPTKRILSVCQVALSRFNKQVVHIVSNYRASISFVTKRTYIVQKRINF